MRKLYFSLFISLLIISMTGADGCQTDFNLELSPEIAGVPSPAPEPLPVDLSAAEFSSNGDLIVGWYWLRDSNLTHQAEWKINNVPTDNGDIVLDMEVLATNTTSGGRGHAATFIIDYCSNTTDTSGERDEFKGSKTPPPPGSESGCTQNITLPNVSPESDPVGYTCQGQVTIPASFINSDGTLNIKVYRAASSDNHVAFNKESIKSMQAGESNLENTENENGDSSGGETTDEQVTNPDSDNDLVPDNNELLYGSDPQNADTDGDEIIDGKEISSLIDPVEPTWNELQKVGMVRIEQPTLFYGLDGWVDVYEKYYSWSRPLGYLKKIAYHEDQGTKKSQMDNTKFTAALDKVFEQDKISCYKLENKTGMDFAVADSELWHDFISDASTTYPAGWLKPKEYRFFYDYLSDFQLAYLKNDEEIKYPSADSFFKYLLYPMQIYQNKEQSIAVQFEDSAVYNTMYDNGDRDYKLPAVMYTIYNNNNFNDDTGNQTLIKDQIAVMGINEQNIFEFQIKLPADKATLTSGYLKITPVWIIKKNSQVDYEPIDLSGWDVKGLTRDIVWEKNDNSSTNIAVEYSSFEGLNNSLWTPSSWDSYTSSANYHTRTDQTAVITRDPNAPENERYHALEMSIQATTYVDKVYGTASNVYNVIETVVIKSNKVKELTNLPSDHWSRQTRYQGPIGIFAAIQGAASVATNGQQAWTAYKNGERFEMAYYTTKGAIGVVNTTANVVKVTENTVGYAGKAGRLAKLTTKKAGVAIAVVTGAVQASYDIYKYNTTNDNILKSAYAESIAADVIDTGISVAAVFSPHTLAVQATWMIEIEIYGLIFGEDFAYKVAKSPGSAVVFLAEYIFTGEVPSQLAGPAYEDARDLLIDRINNDNEVRLPYLTLFVDPDL